MQEPLPARGTETSEDGVQQPVGSTVQLVDVIPRQLFDIARARVLREEIEADGPPELVLERSRDRLPAVLRTLLLSLLALLLTAGVGIETAHPDGPSASASLDCCPSKADKLGETEVTDCCDTDLGRCCSNGTMVLPVAGAPLQRRVTVVSELTALPVPPRHRTRATGPPPTPPPIA